MARVGTLPARGGMFPACAGKFPTCRRMVLDPPLNVPSVRWQDSDAPRKESNAPKNRPDGWGMEARRQRSEVNS